MQVDAMLCDHVQPGGDGKLYVSGAGATLFLAAATRTPFAVRVGVAVTVEMTGDEAPGVHPVEVAVRATDGSAVPLRVGGREARATSVTGELRIGDPPAEAGGDAATTRIDPFCCLLDLDVPAAGTYAVTVAVDGQVRRALPFRTGLVPAPGT